MAACELDCGATRTVAPEEKFAGRFERPSLPSKMNLEELLKAMAAQSPPATPGDVRTEVCCLIAQRPLQSHGWFFELQALFGSPSAILAALTLALAVGWTSGHASARQQDSQRQARAALHLEVFSPRAPGSPAALVAFKP